MSKKLIFYQPEDDFSLSQMLSHAPSCCGTKLCQPEIFFQKRIEIVTE